MVDCNHNTILLSHRVH